MPHLSAMWHLPKLAEWQIVQEFLRTTDPDYVSPLARQERSQKERGNPAERQTAQQRIAREDAYYRQGFPVAGHGTTIPKSTAKAPPAPAKAPGQPRTVPTASTTVSASTNSTIEARKAAVSVDHALQPQSSRRFAP
jgi:hypothetical protein